LVLEGRDLVKQLGGRTVVDRVSLQVCTGEVVGLLGPNGAGKTTLFRMLMGLTAPDGGEIYLGGQRITRLQPHQRARLGLGYLSQQASVFQGLSVADNLKAVLALARRPISRVPDLLQAFELEQVATQRAGLLSGGERRRLELARVFAAGPRLALLDEPFKGLDAGSVDRVRSMLSDGAGRCGVLLTDHALEQTLELCHRVFVLHEGRLVDPVPRAPAGRCGVKQRDPGASPQVRHLVTRPDQRTLANTTPGPPRS